MKKFYLILAFIVCFGFGIILGLCFKNDTKIEYVVTDNNNEKLDEEVKLSTERIESYKKTISDKNKKIEDLENLLNAASLVYSDYQKDVDYVMDKFYEYSFTMHNHVYCGEYSNDGQSINGSVFYESYTFKSINDVDTFFSDFLSNEYYNNNIKRYFLEKDDKIYCSIPGRGALEYKSEKSKFKVISFSDSKIDVYAYVVTDNMGGEGLILAHAVLVNVNGNWVVDEYIEF